MKPIYNLALLIFILPLSGNGQTIEGLTDTLGLAIPQKVMVGSDTYFQTLEADDENPCRLHLSITKTDSRGRMSNQDFYFKPSDLNMDGIEIKTGRKDIQVLVPVKENVALVEYYEDQVPGDYRRVLPFLAADATSAARIKYQLSKLHDPCQERYESKHDYSQLDLDQLLDWLVENTGDVIEADKTIGQEMSREVLQTGERLKLNLSLENRGVKYREFVQVNAGDLDGEKARLDIQGREVKVVVPVVARQRYVRSETSDKRVRYNQSFNVRANTIDDAQAFLEVFRELTPKAKSLMEERLEAVGTPETALSLLQVLPLRTETENGTTRIRLNGDCLTSWKLERKPKKGDAETVTYNVYLQDVEKAEMIVNTSSLEIMFETLNREKYVEVVENGARSSFTNKFNLPVDDVETAKVMLHLLDMAIESCRSLPPDSAGDQPNELMAYLSKLSGKVEGQRGPLQQSFGAVEEGNNCQLRIKHKTEAGRGSGEMVYELAMSDIDPESVRLYISGKSIGIDLNTNRRETLITAIEDGEPKGFESSLRIWAKDLEEARMLAYAIQSLAVACYE
ncbi:MAG: hypothetical protein GYB31_14985 [Bacteroidetes bacterium]|nr:hypothetical protein [Bacteroidota bacterium]